LPGRFRKRHYEFPFGSNFSKTPAVSWLYRNLARPVLFTQNAEEIHNRTMQALGWVSKHKPLSELMEAFLGAPALPVSVFGLDFPNPVGLAAGMDKHAEALKAWQAMGFGFTELGAVTWHAQPGNPSPRVFRAIPEQAIVNRMGFNNPGARRVAETLAECRARGHWPSHPVGMNLGKSKITPLTEAAQDYANSLSVLWEHLDFFVVNVSSPNTPNLRELQDKQALDDILSALQETQAARLAASGGAAAKPILVKVAPDLSWSALDQILELVEPRKIAGLIATNTTIGRPQTTDPAVLPVYGEAGGLSGRPLTARSTEVIRHLFKQSGGKVPIIGVGGIFNADDAWDKITAGASLVQVYTGLVYEGPGLVRGIVRGLLERMSVAGVKTLSAAVGKS
jgi:dihydroorotate dehydrogenase